jgi:hypothetical protein
MAGFGGVACNPTPDAGLNVQTKGKGRGTVVPNFISFLGQFAATLVARPAHKLTFVASSDDRMILLTFAASLTRRFRFARDRHNSATVYARKATLPGVGSDQRRKGGR